MSLLYIWEAGTIFVGPGGGDADKGLNINNIKVADLEEITQEHHPGGSYGAIRLGGFGNKPLTISFKLTGVDPQAMAQYGVNGQQQQDYTILGGVRNKNGNAPMQYKLIAQARMTKVGSDAFKRGDLAGQDYELNEILSYAVYFNGAELYLGLSSAASGASTASTKTT